MERREERRSISVPPPSPFRHSHFSPRSALHHSASHPPSFIPLSTHPPAPPSNQPSSSRLPASNPGPVATLLIAVSKFISGALVGGLPEFSGAEGVIRARVEKAEERGRGGVGFLWASRALFCGTGAAWSLESGFGGRRCRLSAAINTRARVNDLGDQRR